MHMCISSQVSWGASKEHHWQCNQLASSVLGTRPQARVVPPILLLVFIQHGRLSMGLSQHLIAWSLRTPWQFHPLQFKPNLLELFKIPKSHQLCLLGLLLKVCLLSPQQPVMLLLHVVRWPPWRHQSQSVPGWIHHRCHPLLQPQCLLPPQLLHPNRASPPRTLVQLLQCPHLRWLSRMLATIRFRKWRRSHKMGGTQTIGGHPKWLKFQSNDSISKQLMGKDVLIPCHKALPVFSAKGWQSQVLPWCSTHVENKLRASHGRFVELICCYISSAFDNNTLCYATRYIVSLGSKY